MQQRDGLVLCTIIIRKSNFHNVTQLQKYNYLENFDVYSSLSYDFDSKIWEKIEGCVIKLIT